MDIQNIAFKMLERRPQLHGTDLFRKSSGYCTCSNHTKYELVPSKGKRLVVYTRQWDEVKDKGNPVNPLLYKSGVIIHSCLTQNLD
jgi:hypothetical protein